MGHSSVASHAPRNDLKSTYSSQYCSHAASDAARAIIGPGPKFAAHGLRYRRDRQPAHNRTGLEGMI